MKKKILIVSFLVIIYGFFLVNIISPDKEFSKSERRKLQQMPKFTINNVMSKTFMERFDSYLLDQFVLRDKFRSLKANFNFKVLGMNDNNKIYVEDDKIFKSSYPLNQDSVDSFINKMNILNDKYFDKSSNVYLSIIPDKQYYLKDDKHLNIDYDYVIDYVSKNLDSFKFIDLRDSLDINSYYRTDTHWKQEKLENVINTLGEGLGFSPEFFYKENELKDFYGVYYGQSALNLKPDNLVYLTSNILDNVKVNDFYNLNKLYNIDKANGLDKYDIYLSGANPFITLENKFASTDKELIIFRDSFGSSLSPLLANYYKKITIVDMRYMNMDYLEGNVDFTGKEVLVIYNTMIINDSSSLKIYR